MRWQLGMGLPDGPGAFAVSSIALPDDLGDPDLSFLLRGGVFRHDHCRVWVGPLH